jgi:hypothetical protein
LKDFVLLENPNFCDYLRSGWQMSLTVAVDFTASNGRINDPRSLHATKDETNEYE